MLRAAGHGGPAGGRVRLLIGALAIAALLAALMALWQTQFRPLSRPSHCWGAWPGDGGPFDRATRDRVREESAPAPGRPYGSCAIGSARRVPGIRGGGGPG
ncbi:hypothetical protein AB0K09_14005 [Streptomyces sp. NPDC049577]|uniref:hypothetical protein n=1 Tax=Streptomyces sp. NPDC049577 TaxID=3155153 RepID=UPI0034403145